MLQWHFEGGGYKFSLLKQLTTHLEKVFDSLFSPNLTKMSVVPKAHEQAIAKLPRPTNFSVEGEEVVFVRRTSEHNSQRSSHAEEHFSVSKCVRTCFLTFEEMERTSHEANSCQGDQAGGSVDGHQVRTK